MLPSQRRPVRAVYGYFVRPSVLADAILGKVGFDGRKDHAILGEFRDKLFEQTGLDRSRFVALEVGRDVGYCIVLKSNMESITPAPLQVVEKVKEYVAFLGEGPRWFRWRPYF